MGNLYISTVFSKNATVYTIFFKVRFLILNTLFNLQVYVKIYSFNYKSSSRAEEK